MRRQMTVEGNDTMDWYNEPPKWSINGDRVTVQTEPKMDFWRLTAGGYVRDSGHFYYQRQAGDFLAEVKCSGNYNALYDQAGLMVRLDEANWLKCGIEFIDGRQLVSAVVTREYSDWSVAPPPDRLDALWLRLRRQGFTIEVHYALDGVHYQLLRQTYLSPTEIMNVGLMCASPEGLGFPVTFEGFTCQSI
jgi:regulation of enolase protein 1 (concanavalin A-like superfamily)